MIGLRGLPASYGGVEKHVEEIGRRLAADGHEFTIYCRPGYPETDVSVPAEYGYVPPRGREPGRYRGMVLRELPTPGGKVLEATVHSGLAAGHSVGRGYDIVHFHAIGPGIFTPLPQYLTRAKVVQTIHGLDDERAKWAGLASKLMRVGRTLSTHVPDEVIVVSRELGRVYRELHDRDTTYIPNGTPVVLPQPPGPALQRFGLEAGRYVMYLGRMVPEKQPDVLIEAFRAVPGDFRLAMVGGTSNSDEFTAGLHRRAAQDPRVVMTGNVYGADLAELLGHAGLFVQPSKVEGLPITLLEAAAYGRPVLVSDIPPHLEVIGTPAPGRRSFPVDCPESLAAGITESLSDPGALVAGADTLRSEVLAHYDWDRIAEETLRVYRRALG